MSGAERILPALCSVTFRDLDVDTVIELAARHGVEAIEWGMDVHLPPGDVELARLLSGRCRAKGIQALSAGSYVRAGEPGARQQFDRVLESVRALGADNVRVWAGTRCATDTSEAQRDQILSDLDYMATCAADHGIAVSTEFHRNTYTETIEDATELLRSVNHDNLFSYWQPVPGRTLDQRKAELDALQPWLGHLHVFHWIPAEKSDERRPLSEGEALWRPILAQWQNAPHWQRPKLAMLEFVADGTQEQFRQDMHSLCQWCNDV